MPVFLVVEDDAVIRELVTVVFREKGFAVIEAQNVAEALEFLESRSPLITALFSGVHLPSPLDGLALAFHARRRWPSLGIVLASGRMMPRVTDLPDRCRFLRKPFTLAEMVSCMRTVLSP